MLEVGIIVALTLKGTYIGDYEKLREIAREAERIGIDSLWHCDHFVTLDPASYGNQTGFGAQDEKEQSADTAILEPWTTLAALARDTENPAAGHFGDVRGISAAGHAGEDGCDGRRDQQRPRGFRDWSRLDRK